MEDENKNGQHPTQNSQDANADSVGKFLAGAKAHITVLEKTLVEREAEVAGLRQSGQDLSTRLQSMDRSLAEAVTGYRTLVAQANPDVPSELISGDSLEAVGESLKKAKALVDKVKQGIEAHAASGRFPAGSPERGGVEQDLSPREKIERGITGGKR